MPVRYVIDAERRLVITKGWDRVTFPEMQANQDKLLNDPAFDPTFNQLLDWTQATAADVSADHLRTLANRKVFSPTSRRAFVASMPAMFGIGRMAEAFHEMSDSPSRACVFYDMPSALKWLGITEIESIATLSGTPKKEIG